MSLFVRRPETIRFQWTGFLAPFSPALWLGVLGSILVSSAALTIGYRAGHSDWELANSAFRVFALFCGQGDIPTPETTSLRTVLLTVGVASTVVAAAYAGELTSTFAVQTPELPYDSIEEYVADPAFELGISPSSYWVYFQNSTSGLAKDLEVKLFARRNDQPHTRFAGFTKLCDRAENFGWISSAVYEQKYFAQFKCDIVPVPGYIMVDTVSMVVQKGSPYRQLFNRKLSLLRSTGTLSLLHRRTWPEPLSKLETMKPLVNLRQVVPIFVVLALGVAVSAVLTLAENMYRERA